MVTLTIKSFLFVFYYVTRGEKKEDPRLGVNPLCIGDDEDIPVVRGMYRVWLERMLSLYSGRLRLRVVLHVNEHLSMLVKGVGSEIVIFYVIKPKIDKIRNKIKS